MRGHNPPLPLVCWVTFLTPWPITPLFLGLDNLAWRMERQKLRKLSAKEDGGRQGHLSLAQPLGWCGCVDERHVQEPWSQWGMLGTGAVAEPEAAREGRQRSHKKCSKSCFWSIVKYLTIKLYENVNNGDITYLRCTSGKLYLLYFGVRGVHIIGAILNPALKLNRSWVCLIVLQASEQIPLNICDLLNYSGLWEGRTRDTTQILL